MVKLAKCLRRPFLTEHFQCLLLFTVIYSLSMFFFLLFTLLSPIKQTFLPYLVTLDHLLFPETVTVC